MREMEGGTMLGERSQKMQKGWRRAGSASEGVIYLVVK